MCEESEVRRVKREEVECGFEFNHEFWGRECMGRGDGQIFHALNLLSPYSNFIKINSIIYIKTLIFIKVLIKQFDLSLIHI